MISRTIILVLGFLLAACAGVSEPSDLSTPAALPGSPTATTALSVEPTAQPALIPSATPLPTNTALATQPFLTSTPMPSSTPLPVVSLSVPNAWREKALTAVEQLNSSPEGHTWRLVEDDEADVRLVNDSSGQIIDESILVLAVPFTTDWEEVSFDQMEEILSNGHESVTILPWSELTADQKALRIDGLGPADNGYALKETWSLMAEASLNSSLEDLMLLLQDPQSDNVIHLAAVGDIMLDRSLGNFLKQGDILYPFTEVVDQLQGADISVGNIESALGDTGTPEQKNYTFRAPPEAAESLKLAGFDVVSLANNHGMDYGEVALTQALGLLKEQGLVAIGAGANSTAARAPGIVEVNGLKTAFLSYVNVPVEARSGFDTASWTATQETPGIAWADPRVVAEDVAAIRKEVDLVVILLHSGYEYQPAPSEAQQEAAHAAIDAGADLVIGHHAHILQGIEYFKDGVIIYGTGNFAFVIDGPPQTAIFHVWLDRDGVREIAVQPAIVQPGGKPRRADNLEAPAIRNQLYYLTNLLNAQ